MTIDSRTRSPLQGPGPYIGRITNLLDPTFMGAVEVVIEKGFLGDVTAQEQTYIVQYLSPFYGVTSLQFEGPDPKKFDDVQKSYGMWMIPPDIGTRVLVMFIDGDPNQGYWVGCIPDTFQNHMIPGIAASENVYMTPSDESKYGTSYLPVAEFNKKSQKDVISDPNKIKKPIHPFADRLMTQGLLTDTVRGVTSSSARREVPSSVFGISTPGPLDPNGRTGVVGYKKRSPVPVSRLGGTQFVMDDGDQNGQNELVRIRTRTGHQILLHNTADLVYIANSKGTAWIELSSNGKIDVFAQDSVSIHTEADFNFRADRDINIEAGRNINMNAGGGIEVNAVDRFYLICDNNGKIQIGGDYNVAVGGNIKAQAGATTNISSEGNLRISSGSSINVGATGSILQSGSNIHLNGPAAEAATPPDLPRKLQLFTLPNKTAQAGWENKKFYDAGSLSSIMLRVPTHEPWPHHENVNPGLFGSSNTDVQVVAPIDGPKSPTSGTGSPPVNNNPVSQPASKNASSNEIYLQTTLVNAGITDPIKLAAWMAQCKQESGGFIYLRELASGQEYEGRKDLGNIYPGDGVKFKGRGFIQLTGRDVYRGMTKYFNAGVDFEKNPELVEQLDWAARSVLYFFNVYKAYAFKPGFNWDDCVKVTKIVNGGTNGLANRQRYYDEYKAKFQQYGVNPTNTLGSSSGVVLDSSGNPINTGN